MARQLEHLVVVPPKASCDLEAGRRRGVGPQSRIDMHVLGERLDGQVQAVCGPGEIPFETFADRLPQQPADTVCHAELTISHSRGRASRALDSQDTLM